MALDFTMKRHDTLPTRTISLIQTNPANPAAMIPVDLTNAASAKLIAKIASPGGGGDSFVSTLAFGSPRTGGTVIYTPVAGDTDNTGDYQAEIEITWTTPAGVETFPNDSYFTIHIKDDLG